MSLEALGMAGDFIEAHTSASMCSEAGETATAVFHQWPYGG